MTVQEAQRKITSSEFVDWIVFLNEEEKKTTKQDFYLASIIAEVRRSNAKHPNKVKVEDCLISYKSRVKEHWKTKMLKAKAAFGAFLNPHRKK